MCKTDYNEAFINYSSNSLIWKSTTSSAKHLNSVDDYKIDCNYIACPAMYRTNDTKTDQIENSCTKCDNSLINPYLGTNKWYDRDRNTILRKLYNSTDGENWADGGETWIDESIPICEKHCVKCDTAGDIITIQLLKMNLSGSVPEELGLDLSD